MTNPTNVREDEETATERPRAFRLSDDEWARFRAACVLAGTTASEELRRHVRQFVSEHPVTPLGA